jgi:hypothetical protein
LPESPDHAARESARLGRPRRDTLLEIG